MLGLLVLPTVAADTWAVIVAGSNTYANYRHQADACHAYQILANGGVPADHIILMAYDDIASNEENPYPGQIFNKPTPDGVPGYDVYAGCEISYSGDDVTAENFYAVLTGGDAPGPVLQSTENDQVFVYYADHGAVGLVAMPTGDDVYFDELNATLVEMHDKKMYNKLVFYMEACESGSMFEGLDPALNIYATTASNAEESSYGTYCGLDATVDGVQLATCLGDLYSVNWLEDSDSSDEVCGESLNQQFKLVKAETNLSHVQVFGDESFKRDKLCLYQAADCDDDCQNVERAVEPRTDGVDSRDATLYYLMANMVLRDGSAEAVADEVRARDYIDAAYASILDQLAPAGLADTGRAKDGTCLKRAVKAVEAHCGRHTDYGLKHVKTLNNLCNAGFDGKDIFHAAKLAC